MLFALIAALFTLALAMLADKPRLAGPLAGIVILLILAAPAFAAPYIETPPLDRPLTNPTPPVKIITMSADKLARISLPECHEGLMASTVYSCTVKWKGSDEFDIFMPPYPSQYGGEWYAELFSHELEGHALRHLVHYENGRGWKAP